MEEQTQNTNEVSEGKQKYRLKIKDQHSTRPIIIKAYRNTNFTKVFSAFLESNNYTDSKRYKFHYDDQEIDPSQTVEEVLGNDLNDSVLQEEGFTIHAQATQLG